MPKKSIILLLILFPLAVGLACRFTSSPDPTATPTDEPVAVATEPVAAETEAPTLVVVEEPTSEPAETPSGLVVLDQSTWIQEDDLVFVGYLIENPSSEILYENVEFTIRLFGAAGNLIDTGYASLPWFYPNMTTGVVSTFYLADEGVLVDSVNVDWTFTGTESAGTFENPFTSENAVFWDNDGFPVVTGRVVNTSPTTFTDIRADILCYNSAGEIIGGGIGYMNFIHLNDYMGFITYVDVFDDVASIEIFPTLSFGSQFIDKTDFSSEISVVEDYFFEDEIGFMKGGIVLFNETDSVLRFSYVYVTFYDEDDNITTTGSEYINMFLPGDTIGITPWISLPPFGAISVRYDILLLPGEVEEGYELDSNPFRVNSTTVTGDNNEYVTVNFTNTYSKQVSEVDVYVLAYNAEGAIIGGGNTWTTEPTPAGGTGEVEVWVNYPFSETINTVQAWVIPSYWTSFD